MYAEKCIKLLIEFHFSMLNNVTKILISVLLVLDIYALIFLNINPESLTLNWKNIDENITELYFTDHLKLPKKVEANENYSFSFSTHNLENRDMNYIYTVFIDFDGTRFLVDDGTFSLNRGEIKNTQINFSIKEGFGNGNVVVFLNNKNQQINFRISET